MNSEPETMGRNSGIFWGMLEMSLLVGNTFAYFQFKDTDDIGTLRSLLSHQTRRMFVCTLHQIIYNRVVFILTVLLFR